MKDDVPPLLAALEKFDEVFAVLHGSPTSERI